MKISRLGWAYMTLLLTLTAVSLGAALNPLSSQSRGKTFSPQASTQNGLGYPQIAIDSFIQGCASGIASAVPPCQCAIVKIQQVMPYSEYQYSQNQWMKGIQTPQWNRQVSALEGCQPSLY